MHPPTTEAVVGGFIPLNDDVAPSGCMHTHADLELYHFYRCIRSVTYLFILHRVRELLETELQCFNRQVHATY